MVDASKSRKIIKIFALVKIITVVHDGFRYLAISIKDCN